MAKLLAALAALSLVAGCGSASHRRIDNVLLPLIVN